MKSENKVFPAKELFGSLMIKEPTDKTMEEVDEKFRSRFG